MILVATLRREFPFPVSRSTHSVNASQSVSAEIRNQKLLHETVSAMLPGVLKLPLPSKVPRPLDLATQQYLPS